jgi:putative ATP-dependent endonuclease of OLD family
VRKGDAHTVHHVGVIDEVQSTVRLYPEAFLAHRVFICEGASEVGLVRGLDQHRCANGHSSINAAGVALIDCGGGDADRCYARAAAFSTLGYQTAILRDSDHPPTPRIEEAYLATGGVVTSWRNGRTLEDELFLCLTDDAVDELVDYAVDLHGEDVVNNHILAVSNGTTTLGAIKQALALDELSDEHRSLLGKAARRRKAGWFKSVSWMEEVARSIVGPDLRDAEPAFAGIVNRIFA